MNCPKCQGNEFEVHVIESNSFLSPWSPETRTPELETRRNAVVIEDKVSKPFCKKCGTILEIVPTVN